MSEAPKTVGRFEVLAELGRGAMGVVYRGLDPHLGRHVAIKLLAPHLADDEELIGRFTNEARNASQLLHPNIATVFEAGPSDAGWFVAFELVEGPDLRQILSDGRLSVERIVDYIVQIAEGLAVAHKIGIVHRDLKPDNLIITPDGVVKITDFGLAKKMGDPGKTRAGTILGTAYYMAPEQAKGLPVDHCADWFSLGAMTYEMITGERPFSGYHEMAVLYSVVNEEPAPMEEFREDIPEGLSEAVRRMMAKKPEDRLADLNELKSLVQSAAASSAITSVIIPSAALSERIPLLAVLPMENKSPDPEYAFLAEGFAEDIGAALASSPRFRVLSHEKVLSSRPESAAPGEWGLALGVQFIVHGSLFRAGDRLKVRVSLRNLETDGIEWSQSFSGHSDEIFEIQDRVAAEVARALAGEEAEVTSPAAHGSSHSAEAYEFLLRGRDYYRREGRENLEFAIDMFDKALEIDAQYAVALAAQADSYAQMYLMYYDRDRKWLKRAEMSAKSALMIDSELPEAHRALARIMMEYGQNEEAIKELQTAIRNRPDFHEAHRSLAWIYQGMRKYSDSIDWGQKSLRIKPLDRETYLLLGLNYLDLRDWDKARHHFERAIELSPDYGRAYLHLGNVSQKTGDLTGAIRHYHTAMKYLTDINAYIDLGWAQILQGDLADARGSYEKLIEAGFLEFMAFYSLGIIDLLEGFREKAEGRFESTVSMCSKQLRQDEENPHCMMIMAQAMARLQNGTEAIRTAERAMKLEAGNGQFTFELARVQAILADEDSVRKSLKEAFSQPMGPSLYEVQTDPHFTAFDLSELAEPI